MTLKRPKDKGTRFETSTERFLQALGLDAKREDAGNRWDITVRGSTGRTIEALVARENYGPPLATIRLRDFAHLLAAHGDNAHIECKHLSRIALHGVFQSKFE
jgi:hypothetical protein